MKPNWMALLYLAALGAGFVMAVALASMVALTRLVSWLTGSSVPMLDRWLLGTGILVLGILPWPGIVTLARAILRPGKREEFRVESAPVGEAAIVLTALDEERAIEQIVQDFVSTSGVGSVIVVDNGSRDRTRERAASAGARVVLEERRGYGHACIRALGEGLRSGHSIVILCEADGTFRGEDVEKFTAYLRNADLVIGSRTHGALLNGNSQLNSFLTLGNVFVAKLLQFRYWNWKTGGTVRLTDVGCTYRGIRAEALRQILPGLRVGGNHFGPHMVMAALECGLRVVEVPVTFWERIGTSKGGNASWRKAFLLGLFMIWHILTYRTPRRLQMPARDIEIYPVPSGTGQEFIVDAPEVASARVLYERRT